MASHPYRVTNTLRSDIEGIVRACIFELQQPSKDKSIKAFDDLALQLSQTLTGKAKLFKGRVHCSSKTGFLIGECLKVVIDFCGENSKIKHDKAALFGLWDSMSLLQQVLTNGGARYLPGCGQLLDSVFFICFTHISPADLFQHQTPEGLRIRYDDSKEYLINQQDRINTFNQVIEREMRSWIIALSTDNQDGLASVINSLDHKLAEIYHPQTKQAIKWIWFFLLWQEMEKGAVSNSLYRTGLTNLFHWLGLRPQSLFVDLKKVIEQFQAFKKTYNYFFDSNIYWENQDKRLLDTVINTYRRFAADELNDSPNLYKKIEEICVMWQGHLFTGEQEAFQFKNFKALITTPAFRPLIFSILFARLFDTSQSIDAKAIVPATAADSSHSDTSVHITKPKFEVQYLLDLLSVSDEDSITRDVLTVFVALFQILNGNDIEFIDAASVSCFKNQILSKQPMQKLVNSLMEKIVDRSIALASAGDINELTVEEQQRYLNQFDNLNILLSNLDVSKKNLSRLMKSYKVREILIDKLSNPQTEYQDLIRNKQRFKLLMSDQGIQHAWIQHILTVFGDFLDAEQIDDSKFNFYLDKDDNWLQPSKKKGRLQDIKNLTKVLFGYLGEGYPMGISLLPSVIPPDIDCSAIREKLLNKLNDQLEKSLNFDIAAAHQTLSLLELFGESAEKIIEFRTAIDNKALFNDFVDQLNTITARKDHRTFSNQSKDTFKQDKKPSYQPTFIVPTSVVPQHPKIFPFEHALPVSAFPKTFIELAKYIIRQHDGALPLVLAGQAIADLLDEVPLSKINDFDCIWYGTPELWQRLIEKLIADQEKLGLISVERYGENMLHIIANNHSGSAEQAAQTVEIDISYRAIALDGRRLNQILLEDAERRDFKHTAMHIVLNAKQLLRASNLDDDPNQGLLEIHNKLGAFDAAAEHSLAFIGKAKKSIAEDPLRLLRAYRKILRAEVSYTPTPETQLAIDAATKNLNLWINDLSAKRKISSKAWAVRASQISSAFAKVFSNPVVMERLVQNGVLSAMIGFNQLQCEKLWQAYLELERLHDSKAVPLISVMSKQICFYLLIHALYGKTLPKDDAERKQWRPFHLIKWYSNMPPAIKTIAKTLNGSSDQYYISEALTKTFDGLLDKHFPELQPSPLAQDISQSTSKPPSPMI